MRVTGTAVIRFDLLDFLEPTSQLWVQGKTPRKLRWRRRCGRSAPSPAGMRSTHACTRTCTVTCAGCSRCAARALIEYADRKRELGLVDFVDQEHLLLRTLDHPEVRAALAEELDLLLVDEFQDTSPIQLALFLKLAALAREVFWVGDVKQAIYGFRGSDTALMEAVLRELPKIGGTKEVLGSSHRSRPSLVRLVNTVFGSAFAPILPEHEVHLRAQRAEPDIGPAFGNWLLQGANSEEQMAALGAGIRRLLASGCRVVDKRSGEPRPARYGDIAVLARLNDRVTEAVAGLSAQGVPTETAQPGLLGRPEAVLAVACLRRLYDSRDTVATAEILSLADCQAPEVWLQDRLDFLAGGGGAGEWREAGESAHPLIARLAELRAQLPVLTPREALELVITHGDLSRLVLQMGRGRGDRARAPGQPGSAARAGGAVRGQLSQHAQCGDHLRADPVVARAGAPEAGHARRAGSRRREGPHAPRRQGPRVADCHPARREQRHAGSAVVDLGCFPPSDRAGCAAAGSLHPLLALAVRPATQAADRRRHRADERGGALPGGHSRRRQAAAVREHDSRARPAGAGALGQEA